MRCLYVFFNDTATTEIYTLSLHDALPICAVAVRHEGRFVALAAQDDAEHLGEGGVVVDDQDSAAAGTVLGGSRWHGPILRRAAAKAGTPVRRCPGGVSPPRLVSTGSARS